ncbi:methyltransferase family protein [Dyella sp. 20L07]|uniref:methyltransferase family protein n=1 Tax=Dyella sp. 20L07 TaxID=3384240 RepID=UPI003D26E137
MNIGTLAVGLYVVWLLSELVILRRARDRSGADIDDRSLALLASSNFLAAALSVILYFLGIGAASFGLPIQALGIALMLCGFTLRWAGMWTLRRFFSANVAVQDDHQLIIEGPYKLVRHPGYFGGWLAFVGFGLALSNGVALFILVILTVPAFLYRIRVEEKALRGAFVNYADYASRVKKFIPYIW